MGNVLLLHLLNLPANLSVFFVRRGRNLHSNQPKQQRKDGRQDKTNNVWHLTSANLRYIPMGIELMDVTLFTGLCCV